MTKSTKAKTKSVDAIANLQTGNKGRKASGDDVIYREILAAILDHRLPPGTKLREDAIGEIFGVSRTVVRSVISRLVHDHMLDAAPYRSATVARPSPQDARDVFGARIVIENEIVRVATQNAGKAQIKALRDLVEREAVARQSGDRAAQITLSGEFHLMLAEICGNAVLENFLKELVSRTSLIIALYETPGQSACACDEHAGLIDTIEAGDLETAAEQMRVHLQQCLDNLQLEEASGEVDLADVFGGLVASPGKSR